MLRRENYRHRITRRLRKAVVKTVTAMNMHQQAEDEGKGEVEVEEGDVEVEEGEVEVDVARKLGEEEDVARKVEGEVDKVQVSEGAKGHR